MTETKQQQKKRIKLLDLFKGFTLIELLVVIAIIGILASLAITSFQFVLLRAQDTRNKSLAGTVGSAIAQYGVDHGEKYPIAASGQVDISSLEGDLAGYLNSNAALTQATGVAKYMSSADGSSFAAVWELKYGNDPTVTTGNGVYLTDAANLAGAVSIPGVLGDAINFGGGQTETQPPVQPSSTVTIPYNEAMDFDSNFTISFWFKTAPWYISPSMVWIVTKFEGTSQKVPFLFRLERTDSGRPNKFQPVFYRATSFSSEIKVISPAIITDGDGWHHLVGMKNGTNISLIIDNSTPVTLPDLAGLSDNLGPIKSGNPTYNGDLDDFRIYNTALTTGAGSQVEALFNAGKGSAVNPLLNNTVGHWRFDESSGSVLKNSGSATLVNPTTLIDGTLSDILSGTWTKGIVPRFGFTEIGSPPSLLGRAFGIYGPQ